MAPRSVPTTTAATAAAAAAAAAAADAAARRPAVAATATIHRHHHHQSHTRTRPSTPTHADDNYEALRCYTEGTDIIEELRSLRNSPWAVDLGREDGLPCNPRVVLHAGRYRVSLLPTM